MIRWKFLTQRVWLRQTDRVGFQRNGDSATYRVENDAL